MDKYDTIKDLYLFCRKLTYKYLFDDQRIRSKWDKELSESIKHFIMEEFRAFRDLILLLEESETAESSIPTTDITHTPTTPLPPKSGKKFKSKSKKFPDLASNPHIWAFLTATIGDLRRLTLDPMPSNLRPDQLHTLN